MTSLARAVAAFCAALMLVAAAPVRAEPAADEKRGEFERMIKEYLATHPEAIQEALDLLASRKAAAKAEQQRTAIKTIGRELFSSPRQVTLGNRTGDVTLVEFFDYNCGYCKRALTDLLALMKNDPKLKVVLKEYPILGPDSVAAARVADLPPNREPWIEPPLIIRSADGQIHREYRMIRLSFGIPPGDVGS